MNIAHDHHNRIIYQFIELQRQSTCFICMFTRMTLIHFLYCCKYGVLVFDDDGTGPADESKQIKCIKGRSCQIMGGRFLIFAMLLLCEITMSFV